MRRPLVITDCDEVLLHMVRHFREWLDEEHDIAFALEGNPFVQSMSRRGDPAPIPEAEVWTYLNAFFESEMSRQTPIERAVEAIAELQRDAEVVVLTNLVDRFNDSRRRQLLDHGITARVFTNQGPKGPALKRIIEEYAPDRAVFIDDIAHHHQSVAQAAPDVARLHFCGERAIAPHIPCGREQGYADARIDNWKEALPWLLETLHGQRP